MNATNETRVAGTRRTEVREFFGESLIVDVEVTIGRDTRIISAMYYADQPTKLWLDAPVWCRFVTGNKVHVDRRPIAWLQDDGKTARIGEIVVHNRNRPVAGWYDEKAENEGRW